MSSSSRLRCVLLPSKRGDRRPMVRTRFRVHADAITIVQFLIGTRTSQLR
jgi:hypothetical protein